MLYVIFTVIFQHLWLYSKALCQHVGSTWSPCPILFLASNMNPKKITGCSQPYDIDELVIQIGDADVCSIYQYFEEAGKMIGKMKKMVAIIIKTIWAYLNRSVSSEMEKFC